MIFRRRRHVNLVQEIIDLEIDGGTEEAPAVQDPVQEPMSYLDEAKVMFAFIEVERQKYPKTVAEQLGRLQDRYMKNAYRNHSKK